MKKELFYNIRKMVICLCVLTVVAITLLTLVNCISNELIQVNYDNSIARIEQLEGYGWIPFRFSTIASCADNVTDHTMLLETMLKEGFNAFTQVFDNRNYARYWHGYILFLKPLLVFFNLEGIRIINMIVFYSLLGVLFVKLKERTGTYFYSLTVLISFVLTYIYIIPICMQYFNIFINAMISSIIILQWKDIHTNKNRYLFFFIIGCLTSFFDFLTVPVLTIGLPLFIYYIVDPRKDYNRLLEMLLLSVSWLSGYGGFWAIKWIVSSIVLQKNILLDGLNSMNFRINGSEMEGFSRYNTLKNQILFFFKTKRNFLIFSGAYFIGLLKISFKNWNLNNRMIPFVLLSMYPIVWYLVIAGHSYVHSYMTYRGMILYFISGTTIVYEAFFTKKKLQNS